MTPQEKFNVDELDCWLMPSPPKTSYNVGNTHLKGVSRPVRGTSKDGKVVQYRSTSEAANALWCKVRDIAASARGERSYIGGYRWQYVEQIKKAS